MQVTSEDATVVKIGGSLLNGESLDACLAAVAKAPGRVAIVPGGGVFADTVRATQRAHGIAEADAHCMALLAMAQFAHLLAARHARMIVAFSLDAARIALEENFIPVWAPLDIVTTRRLVPENWDMTSDSLAAWFAGRVGARRLLLVKSAQHDPALTPANRCVAEGLVDPLFPAHMAEAGIEAYWIGGDNAARLAAFLSGDPAHAVAIAA